MKLCRFQTLEFTAKELNRSDHRIHPEIRNGVIEGNEVREIPGQLWTSREPTGRSWPLSSVKLLPPCIPSKIVCVGRNYLDHAKELGNEAPKEPLIFLKPPSSVVAPDEPIVIPQISKRVDYEGELAAIVGRRCQNLQPNENISPYILGYTCLNDVTARDLQKLDVQFTRAKGFDTFCPLGPVIETSLDLADATVETFVNGTSKQYGHTSEMIFSLDVIIRYIVQVMTLEPGDVIATGTPSGVGSLVAGDVVEVSVSGVGTLRNPVIGSVEDPEY
ncbi:MAG: fumarylacetoacetate hydrolase family protein [Candidatus Acidiferrales bacterium]|jgi:2-keto-4-pentenoate hydratase/2-oxohepta-3-ene-1,7-dioic acid hydratase in catechol pathway